MNRTNRSVLVSLIFTLMLASGCASVYRSPEARTTPISELAILFETTNFAYIRKVDGKLLAVASYKKFELAPGFRTITIFLVSGYALAGEVTVEFEALAGEQYELKAAHNDKRWRWESWIVRKGTDDVVSRQVETR